MNIEAYKQIAWENATPIDGEDPNDYRRDFKGIKIYRESYGKNSYMGWELGKRDGKLIAIEKMGIFEEEIDEILKWEL